MVDKPIVDEQLLTELIKANFDDPKKYGELYAQLTDEQKEFVERTLREFIERIDLEKMFQEVEARDESSPKMSIVELVKRLEPYPFLQEMLFDSMSPVGLADYLDKLADLENKSEVPAEIRKAFQQAWDRRNR